MNIIKLKGKIINLNFETQISNNGRPFRLSGTRLNLRLPIKWVDGIERHHVIHLFKYLDEDGGFFEVEVDYNGVFVALIKNQV